MNVKKENIKKHVFKFFENCLKINDKINEMKTPNRFTILLNKIFTCSVVFGIILCVILMIINKFCT